MIVLGGCETVRFRHSVSVLALDGRGAALVRICALCLVPAAWLGCSPMSHPAVVRQIDTTTPLPSEAFYCPEEYLKWSLRWKGLEGASSEMVTGKAGQIDGEEAIIVYSLSRSSELAAIFVDAREELTSQISLVSGRPLRNDSENVEDDTTEALSVVFTKSGLGHTTRLSGQVQGKRWTQEAPTEIADMHAVLARLRVWDGLPAGGVFAFVQSGRSHYRLEVVASPSSAIHLESGTYPAIQLEGVATRLRQDGHDVPDPEVRQFKLWRSDDGRFLPLKFEVDTRLGPIQGTLVDFRRSDGVPCITVAQHRD